MKGIRKGAAPVHRSAHGHNTGGSAPSTVVACDVAPGRGAWGLGAEEGGAALVRAGDAEARRFRAREVWRLRGSGNPDANRGGPHRALGCRPPRGGSAPVCRGENHRGGSPGQAPAGFPLIKGMTGRTQRAGNDGGKHGVWGNQERGVREKRNTTEESGRRARERTPSCESG
jgi:hypothetical protein